MSSSIRISILIGSSLDVCASDRWYPWTRVEDGRRRRARRCAMQKISVRRGVGEGCSARRVGGFKGWACLRTLLAVSMASTLGLMVTAGSGSAQQPPTTWNVSVGGETPDHAVQLEDYFPR